jgi:hypothetical protein
VIEFALSPYLGSGDRAAAGRCLAASALAHELALANLNRSDFEPASVKFVDPLA